MRSSSRLLVLLLAMALAACAARQRAGQLDETLRHYNTLIRWSEFAAAADYYDPEMRQEQPLDGLAMRRLSQFRVSGYQQRALEVSPDGSRARQVVEIRLYNLHDMTERTVVDRQVWRYDAERERWWLTTGLPDVTAGRASREPQGARQ